jgi:hypothetical protein
LLPAAARGSIVRVSVFEWLLSWTWRSDECPLINLEGTTSWLRGRKTARAGAAACPSYYVRFFEHNQDVWCGFFVCVFFSLISFLCSFCGFLRFHSPTDRTTVYN